MIKNYYTFNECFRLGTGYTLNPTEISAQYLYNRLMLIDENLDDHGKPTWISSEKDEIKELCKSYIYPLMQGINTFFFASYDDYDISTEAKWKESLGKASLPKMMLFLQRIFTTKDKYIKLINLQNDNITNIIADIERVRIASDSSNGTSTESTGFTRAFNDTPESTGSYTGSEYTSNITQDAGNATKNDTLTSSSTITDKTPIGSLAEKLASAEKALRDYYEDWAWEVCKNYVIIV